jgi:hypothetical protein
MRERERSRTPENREQEREQERKRRETPEYRARALERSRRPEIRQQIREWKRNRAPQRRAREREQVRERYRTDFEYRLRETERARNRNRLAPREAIPFSVLWLEQDGKCYLCGIQMHYMPVRPRDPLAVSPDHRIPIKLKGQNTRENVALTHLWCNQKKGARTIEEYEAALTASAPSVLAQVRERSPID